ncbi:MAG: hypothetical protein KF845_09150 [Cyclobacteriaceae bacterium]|nr:hypothetical protein [Cyclobacteriaceae bacterium]
MVNLVVTYTSRLTLMGLLLLGVTVYAQEPSEETRSRSSIIDDSTKQIYGPTTSQFFLEDDLFRNKWVSYPIDTVIRNFHFFSFEQRGQNLYQDLGNIGTAIRPVYEYVPDVIGASSGFNAYNLYWNSLPHQFFNTRSPYTNLNVILGGKGRSLTNIIYSRNINPRWNIGFHYNGIFIDKQIQRQGKGDRNARAESYGLFTSYHNKDSSYTALVRFKRMYHRVFEYGGVRVADQTGLFDIDRGYVGIRTTLPTSVLFSDLFEDNAQPWLTQAQSNDLRRNYHLYHQYKVGEALQVYHRLDGDRQQNRFEGNFRSEPFGSTFFDAVVIDSALIRDQTKFNTLRNEAGIKGNLLKLFYNGYVAFRNYNMDYKYFLSDGFYRKTRGTEFYVGGRMELQLDSLIQVRGHLESMLDARYRLSGSIDTKWFSAYLKRSVSSPSFLQQAYRGSHDIWMNYFSPVESSEVGGNLVYNSDWLKVYPGVRLSTFRNLVFFKKGNYSIDQTVLPIQSTGFQTVASPELALHVRPFKNTWLTTRTIYTRVLENADNALQIPELLVNAQLSYANIWFGGNFDFHVGVDLHWKSSYHAYGYDPAIQQFYTQQQYKSPSFPMIDVFLSAKIIRGRILLKYNNIAAAFSKHAQVPTPFYPGVVNVFDFGFDWSFYD